MMLMLEADRIFVTPATNSKSLLCWHWKHYAGFVFCFLSFLQFLENAFEGSNKTGCLLSWSQINIAWKLKAMLHEAIFLATCNATNVAFQVATKK